MGTEAAMPTLKKTLLNPFYQAFIRLPGVRQAIARETRGALTRAIFRTLIEGDFGAVYGVTRPMREQLVEQFKDNCTKIEAATGPDIHAVLAMEVLSLPRTLPGAVIECGAFKGASTASLSRVCRLVGRRLIVCDSFEGLPDEGEKLHVAAHFGHYGYYKKGMFCGRLEEVQENVRRQGDFEVCDWVLGFFCDSLPSLKTPLAFGFLDVDLVGSMQDCLRHVWPLLAEGGSIYIDDAGDLDLVRVFFDEKWWQEVLHQPAPGFVGSGCGLPLTPGGSSLGYVRKTGRFDAAGWKRVPWLHYPDAAGQGS
jgi:hypothetical protein